MKPILFDRIPAELRESPQWVLWRSVERDGKKTKVPVQVSGTMAKSNDSSTWCDFGKVQRNYRPTLYAGIGFVFSPEDDFVGVDLDGCRNSETGWVAPWAKEIILKFASYAEVSPSETGVKIFCRGTLPFSCGRKIELTEEEDFCPDKKPAIEAYDRGRYFAVTGQVLKDQNTLASRQEALDWLKSKYWKAEPAVVVADFQSNDAVVERARKYLQKISPAVSGQGGQGRTFHAACVLVLDFELSEADAMGLLAEWNASCAPLWSEKDLRRKVTDAMKQPGARGRLRNAAPANWSRIAVSQYVEPEVKVELACTTIAQAAKDYLSSLARGEQTLVGTGIPDLDSALGGGVNFGEMIIFAGRPSEGKSAVALQCLHYWTEQALKGVIISEEMTALVIGKRSVHYITPLQEEHWRFGAESLAKEVDVYASTREACYIIEQCSTTERAIFEIEKKADEGIRVAVVDYAQLLTGPGKSQYEKVTATSIALQKLARRRKLILLVLCQMNREFDKENREPRMSDIRDSGQLEQDADTICFLHWPWFKDRTKPENLYKIFVRKNRNRGVREDSVTCRFLPDRQMFLDASIDEFAPFAIPR